MASQCPPQTWLEVMQACCGRGVTRHAAVVYWVVASRSPLLGPLLVSLGGSDMWNRRIIRTVLVKSKTASPVDGRGELMGEKFKPTHLLNNTHDGLLGCRVSDGISFACPNHKQRGIGRRRGGASRGGQLHIIDQLDRAGRGHTCSSHSHTQLEGPRRLGRRDQGYKVRFDALYPATVFIQCLSVADSIFCHFSTVLGKYLHIQ